MTETALAPVRAAAEWPTNAHMIAEIARLGYLDGRVVDTTYGEGVFWRIFSPGDNLTCHDLFKLDGVDFRNLPHPDDHFDAAVIDGPYRLNGQPDPAFDARYGTDKVTSWQDRHHLICQGITECARVTKPGGYVLVKCQAQVCSGQVRWQDRIFADHGESVGLTLVDRFDLLGSGRDQPQRTRQDGTESVQQHAYGRPSTMLVLQKPKRSKRKPQTTTLL